MSAQRGLVISAPAQIAGKHVNLSGRLDTQELRFSLLFWDKLDMPTNNLIHIEGGPEVEFLQSAGILRRTGIDVEGGGDMSAILPLIHWAAYRQIDAAEPGMWSLGSGKNSTPIPPQDLAFGRGILVRLHDAIPVPQKDVPLADILEFKVKRQNELLALRHHLDAIYQKILAAGDGELAMRSEVDALERSILDYINAAKGIAIPFVNMSFDANLNVLSIPAGVTTGLAAYATGFSAVSSIMTGAAAALSIGPTASLKGREASATPFRYISSFHKRVF